MPHEDDKNQQVLNPTPLDPTPATYHKRKQKLRSDFRKVALQKMHCNIRFSAVRTSFLPKAVLHQTKLHGNIEKAALQESGFPTAFLWMPCSHVNFRLPSLGPAETDSRSELHLIDYPPDAS